MLIFVIDEHLIKISFRIDGTFNHNVYKGASENIWFEVDFLGVKVINKKLHVFVLLKIFNIGRSEEEGKVKFIYLV